MLPDVRTMCPGQPGSDRRCPARIAFACESLAQASGAAVVEVGHRECRTARARPGDVEAQRRLRRIVVDRVAALVRSDRTSRPMAIVHDRDVDASGQSISPASAIG